MSHHTIHHLHPAFWLLLSHFATVLGVITVFTNDWCIKINTHAVCPEKPFQIFHLDFDRHMTINAGFRPGTRAVLKLPAKWHQLVYFDDAWLDQDVTLNFGKDYCLYQTWTRGSFIIQGLSSHLLTASMQVISCAITCSNGKAETNPYNLLQYGGYMPSDEEPQNGFETFGYIGTKYYKNWCPPVVTPFKFENDGTTAEGINEPNNPVGELTAKISDDLTSLDLSAVSDNNIVSGVDGEMGPPGGFAVDGRSEEII